MAEIKFDDEGQPVGTFEEGINYSISLLAQLLGISDDDFSWDAATEEYEGDVAAVMCSALEAGLGENWQDLTDNRGSG